jgi:hypothetical protein
VCVANVATTKMAKGIRYVRRLMSNEKHYGIQKYASREHAEHSAKLSTSADTQISEARWCKLAPHKSEA